MWIVTVPDPLSVDLPLWTAPSRPPVSASPAVRKAEVVSALSYALDLTTGQPVGHSVRSCVLGLRLAEEIQLPAGIRNDLFYALLLKDAGCSSNASKLFHALGSDEIKAKRDVKYTDWTRLSWETVQYALSHVAVGKPLKERMRLLFELARTQKRQTHETTKIRCERGAGVARLIGLPESTAAGIGALDEHWDGRGEPDGLRKGEIPMFSRIMLLAQTLEIFFQARGADEALAVARKRSGRWFDPELVKAAYSLARRGSLWSGITGGEGFSLALEMDTRQETMMAGDATLDAICTAFAGIVDAKSPFTYQHSNGVANAAVTIARALNLSPERVMFIRHAGLLHDIGKMAISNSILEKTSKLDDSEWKVMRLHPYYTWKVLGSITGFGELSEVSASHHEKLDGTGYFRGLTGAEIPLEARILVVADIFDALAANRPYRGSLPREKVFEILRKDAPRALDMVCVEALERSGAGCDQSYVDLQTLNERLLEKAHRESANGRPGSVTSQPEIALGQPR